MLMAGMGIDAAMLASTHPGLKRTLGAGGIAIGALAANPGFRPFGVRVTVDGQPAWDGRALQVLVGNSRRYAAVLDVTPDACVDDGLLDVLIVPSGRIGGAIRLSWSLVAHRRTRPGDAPVFRGRELAFEVDRAPALELDGGHLDAAAVERAGPGRYVVAAEPGVVRAWVPRSYAGSLFSATSSAT
jgi:diacylglycerol kinase family enzyme